MAINRDIREALTQLAFDLGVEGMEPEKARRIILLQLMLLKVPMNGQGGHKLWIELRERHAMASSL
jgi:hypothetical protein